MLALDTLCKKIGYTFNNTSLLVDALSHRSFRGNKNNERLEFLGDAILSFVIAAALFRRHPESREGELSRLRASLVRGETLAILSQEFQIGNHLRLGPGEIKSGGSHRTSILADALEAVVGAIYLDGGMAACEQCILNWYRDRLSNFSELPNLKDSKTRLQEYLQAKQYPLPCYEILSIEGEQHAQIFWVKCSIEGLKQEVVGTGSSRRRAEQDAAQKIMELIEP
jgi:ribonuclease-3